MSGRKISARRAHLAQLLGKAWDAVQALNFVSQGHCTQLSADIEAAKRGREIDPQAIAASAEIIKARASEALRGLFAAYEQAVSVQLEEDREEAA